MMMTFRVFFFFVFWCNCRNNNLNRQATNASLQILSRSLPIFTTIQLLDVRLSQLLTATLTNEI